MPEQELDLLWLTAAAVAQLPKSPLQVMRCNLLQARSLAATLRYVPAYILGDAFPQRFPRSGNCSKDPSLRDLGCYCPLIERRFDPLWNCNRADVALLAASQLRSALPRTSVVEYSDSAGKSYLDRNAS